MSLKVFIMGRFGTGKTTFLCNLSPQYKSRIETINTLKQQKNITYSFKFNGEDYKFRFVDNVGLTENYLGWANFDKIQKDIDFFIIFVTLHKQKNGQTGQLKQSKKSWQDAKFSITQLKQRGVNSSNIIVIGNMFNVEEYELIDTRELRSHLFSQQIKYYEFNIIQQNQCEKVLQKVLQIQFSLSYSNQFKGITNFTACLIGYLGSGKSSICAAMTNNKIDQGSTTQNKLYQALKNLNKSQFAINLLDTPGLNFEKRKTLINLSKSEGFDFYIYVMDLSDPMGLKQLQKFFKFITSKQWLKVPDNVLIIGNKSDQAIIDECQVRKQFLGGFGQKYRFNYVETNALNKNVTSLCLNLVIESYSIYKIKLKKEQLQKAYILRQQQEQKTRKNAQNQRIIRELTERLNRRNEQLPDYCRASQCQIW